ncbi:MAG: DNA metabolism protein [Ruminococcaceae bacterium]|nr:DNA metabolism protein [Oscillospiraceae bacterium]
MSADAIETNREHYIYIYDGSFEGFLSVVFEAWKISPSIIEIKAGENSSPGFFDKDIYIITDITKTARVLKWMRETLPLETTERIYDYFASEDEGCEKRIYLYLRACHKLGRWVDSFLTEECVADFLRAEKHFNNEHHRMRGFTRFSVLKGGVMYAEIETDFNQLQRLARFFLDRMPGNRFMIYDSKRHKAVICDGYRWGVMENITPQSIEEQKDDSFEKLWRTYLKAVTIEERKNHKLQKQLMPLKYRKNITEFQ